MRSFPIKNLTDHQYEELSKVEKADGLAFIAMCWGNAKETTFISEFRNSLISTFFNFWFYKIPDMPRFESSPTRFIPPKPFDCELLIEGVFAAIEFKYIKDPSIKHPQAVIMTLRRYTYLKKKAEKEDQKSIKAEKFFQKSPKTPAGFINLKKSMWFILERQKIDDTYGWNLEKFINYINNYQTH